MNGLPVADERIPVTVPLPRRIYEKVADSAARGHRSVEEEVAGLVETGLASETSVDAILDEAHSAYLSHMKQAGRQPHTAEELWEQMRRVRKEVADELDS